MYVFCSIILQVAKTLGRLESVANFTEFVKAFSVFGAEMVELAHVTGKSIFVIKLYSGCICVCEENSLLRCHCSNDISTATVEDGACQQTLVLRMPVEIWCFMFLACSRDDGALLFVDVG